MILIYPSSTESQQNLPHFPWKRIDLMSQADKVASKRRAQFEAYLVYLVEARAFYSDNIANVLLHFLEVCVDLFNVYILYAIIYIYIYMCVYDATYNYYY